MARRYPRADSGTLIFCAALFDVMSCHTGAKKNIPVDKPGLGKICFDADGLMMYIVVIGRVAAEHLEWVEREVVPAVVVDRFAGGEDEKEHRLAD